MVYSLLLALHAAAFVAFSGLSRSTMYTLASPTPITSASPTADYLYAALNKTQNTRSQSSPTSVLSPTYSRTRRPVYQRNGDLSTILGFYHGANDNAKKLDMLAAQSGSVEDNKTFQKDCVYQLTSFNTNLLGFQSALDALGSGKGLAYYDRNNDLETLLKDIVNVNKLALSATTTITYNIPVLGPILGPIVYEIKCILDDVLNFCENLSDAVINALRPALQALIGSASTAACNGGVVVAGLCI